MEVNGWRATFLSSQLFRKWLNPLHLTPTTRTQVHNTLEAHTITSEVNRSLAGTDLESHSLLSLSSNLSHSLKMQTSRQSTRLLRSITQSTHLPISATRLSASTPRRFKSTSSHPLSGSESFNSQGNPLAGPSKEKEIRSGPPTELLTVLEETIKVKFHSFRLSFFAIADPLVFIRLMDHYLYLDS